MSNQAHLLEPSVHAAATAIANARAGRRGAPAIADILDVLPPALFTEVVEDARVALAAGTAETAPSLRQRGPLNGADAAGLGLLLNASTALILVRDRTNATARAALWAVAAEAAILGHAEAQALWFAVSGVLRTLPDTAPDPSAVVEEPRP